MASTKIVSLLSLLWQQLQSLITFILLGDPYNSFATTVSLWFIRVLTLSLLLRTYFGPWFLALLSDHIRVRSISIWSVRGLYIRRGTRVLRVDRISYVWSQASHHLTVKIEGINLHIAEQENPDKKSQRRRHNRNLTLADFNPSPIARYLWQFISLILAMLEPYFRPVIRTYVIACLRLGIQWLPKITQALSFDLQKLVITFAEIPEAKIITEEISLHAALVLTHLDSFSEPKVHEQESSRRDTRTVYSMGMWKRRLAEGFQRSFDKALGDTRGVVKFSLGVTNIIGLTSRTSYEGSTAAPFLLSPGVLNLYISAKFNPKEGAIESHGLELSLKIGDCSAKVDVVNVMLDTLFHINSQSPISDPFSVPVTSALGSGSSSSGLSPPFPNIFASPLFSPSLFSPSETLSPTSGQFMSPQSLKSPSSPFLQAISASIRPQRRFLGHPTIKLKDFRDKSLISILNNVDVSISSISLSILSDAETGFNSVIENLSLNLSVSDPSVNHLHKNHLGSRGKSDSHDSDAYSLKLIIHRVSLERQRKQVVRRFAKAGFIDFHVLAFQWPAPFLIPVPFIANDPNTPFLGVQIKCADLHLTDRILDMKDLIEMVKTRKKVEKSPRISGSATLPIPRLSVSFECGPVIARIIYDSHFGRHRAIELRSNGFSTSLSSEYKHPSFVISRSVPAASSVQMLLWNCAWGINFEPVLVRARPKDNLKEPTVMASDRDFLDDPPIMSIGIAEFYGVACTMAQLDASADSMANIDLSTLYMDVSIAVDTVCVELWHPTSIDASLHLFSESIVEPSGEASSPKPLHALPDFSLKVALSRFVVFVTSPDINPDDNLELSRGFAMHTSLSFECCSLQTEHLWWLNKTQGLPKRAELQLPQGTLTKALAAARSSPFGNRKVFLTIHVNNLAFKAAVATQYEADEPTIIGRDDLLDISQEFLRINTAHIDCSLNYRLAPKENEQSSDNCEVSIQIPMVQLYLKLAHVYSILLGLETISVLNPPRPSSPVANPPYIKPKIKFDIEGCTSIHVTVTLPAEKLIIRVDALSGRLNLQEPPKLKWKRLTALVSLPAQVNRWEEAVENKCDELLILYAWEIAFTSLAGSLCISLDGQSAHLTIPHGFIMANLIQDCVISAKAIRHLSHLAKLRRYSDMPFPKQEGPKSVPHLTIRLDRLCFDIQDDPLETRLGLIWQAGGDFVKQKLDREDAFKAKVATVLSGDRSPKYGYRFDSKHTVSIEEARRRLDDVHAIDWTLRVEQSMDRRAQDASSFRRTLSGAHSQVPASDREVIIPPKFNSDPPLLRAEMHNLCLTVSPPSFDIEQLPEVLHEFGNGLPRDTQFSLLVPLHIHCTLSSFQITLRDYPLPLLSIREHTSSSISWTLDTDVIVGEEIGTNSSVEWIACPIIEADQAIHGEATFSISVPKTIMPVKSYARPIIKITTTEPSILSWGVSYGPAIQDVMRLVDTLSSAPRDSSPALGFWDKMRLIFHWIVKVTFCGDVRLYIKGSRDPYNLVDNGSGFVLCWQGNPEIRVGYENKQKEFIQVISDGMLIAIPNLDAFDRKDSGLSFSHNGVKPFEKICARLTSGVRYGIGFMFERSCGVECSYCSGTSFQRKCRYFSFIPHYEVKLEKKISPPKLKSPDDSYSGFRSDFIHLSVSLASSTKVKESKTDFRPSNLYLTPKLFAHFWSWCSLFDGVLTLPIRQGKYHPTRPISPKLGRHLATLKYRISLPHLYFVHGYIDDARETWVDGVVPWVGLKGKVDELLVDMHQREEEHNITGPLPNTTRIVRKKPFYAAEVTMKGIELRAMLAVFSESMRHGIDITAPPQRSNYRKYNDLPVIKSSSIWHDLDDFVELGWSSIDRPALHLLPLASCPHFAYFKRNTALHGSIPQTSKFGSEHSHFCLLGKELSVPRTQMSLASARVAELRQLLEISRGSRTTSLTNDKFTTKMIDLLEDYIAILKEVEMKPDLSDRPSQSYHMPSDIVSSVEWAEFDNVYQIHCPSIFMDSAVRDIMMQYYYCSRDRRGFEYHMATRAVKFIRDQANAALAVKKEEETSKERGPYNTAQIAASALRRMLKGEISTKISVDVMPEKDTPNEINPLEGWADGVSLQKSHCCLLLKPQIVLRGEGSEDTCVLAAAQAKLQSFAILDLLNLDDPISGKVMSRNYTSLSGLQAFAPMNFDSSKNFSVPLEVLIDLRCESDAFERLVPQTEATFHYDKFNRLRLRNNITSVVGNGSHLQDQTDLIRVHIPRFTVSANTEHFQAIANILTKLLLFSDAAHKTRLDRLETLIFTYDFTDLASAADVVSKLQGRLRDALDTERQAYLKLRRSDNSDSRLGLLQIQAHIFLLIEELNLLFDSIKMSQDRFDEHTDQKSALLLHASSSEISWRMLDARRNLLSKLVVANIDFHWLSRQDSSTVNNLTIGNLTAFDGSRYALWAEILAKYDDPPSHPLLKRGLFLLANWTILAPVGGITIYEAFELSLHPLRLQIDSKVGRRIMEYVWPDRKNRMDTVDGLTENLPKSPFEVELNKSPTSARSSIDSPRALYMPKQVESSMAPALRKLGSSRSFTDLRSAKEKNSLYTPDVPPLPNPSTLLAHPTLLKRTKSSESVNVSIPISSGPNAVVEPETTDVKNKRSDAGDAQVMKSRSSQKSFVLVRVSSLHILLSVVKEGSFECHDAKIKTRELEYRNQTWSFEELVNQFIPSDTSWRGWVKMAFHQPLVPVIPVARELLSKTKWTASKSNQPHDSPLKLLHPRIFATDDDHRLTWMLKGGDVTIKAPRGTNLDNNAAGPSITSLPITAEPEAIEQNEDISNAGVRTGRKRVKSLFSKATIRHSKGRGD